VYVVFLTGGLASGKSTVAGWLAEKGATLVDLDAIAKETQETDSVLAELKQAFGSDIVAADGSLRRDILAERAFFTPESAARLNTICWPPVFERLSELLVGGSCQPIVSGSMVVVQIPLLVESGVQMGLADEVVAVTAPEALRIQRAQARGMSAADASARIALQATDEQRQQIANTVLDNSGSLAELRSQVDDWYRQRTAEKLL